MNYVSIITSFSTRTSLPRTLFASNALLMSSMQYFRNSLLTAAVKDKRTLLSIFSTRLHKMVVRCNVKGKTGFEMYNNTVQCLSSSGHLCLTYIVINNNESN